MKRAAVIVSWTGLWLAACSSDVDQGRRCSEDRAVCTTIPPGAGAAGAAGKGAGISGAGGAGTGGAGDKGVVGSDNELSVRVQDLKEMTIEIITLACAGDCADIEVVAHGGNAPYAFAWEDGSTSVTRHVCLDASTTLSVSATDTAIIDDEFSYDARTVSTNVEATVLDCTPDAGTPDAGTPPTCFLPNPSFEGTPALNVAGLELPDWAECAVTPDVNPFAASLPASDGDTYLGMIATSADIAESAGAAFCTPLQVEQSVPFSVDVAVGSLAAGSAQLELWGGATPCSKDELLWVSPIVDDIDTWHTFCGTLAPTKTFAYLVLWPVPRSEIGIGPGAYVLVDNFRSEPDCE